MERKVGEIFDYKGDWYQCVEGLCRECCFRNIFRNILCDRIKCNSDVRKDGKNISFKKLEKVGEPFTCNHYGDNIITMQEYRVYDIHVVSNVAVPMYITDEKHKRVAIEIKQNKEDM